MIKDIDQESRDKIRNIINQNFFVEAGAGSGKTTVLVDRMVAMVEQGVDISKICAITFTKAAAGEFYARFQKKLSESKSEKASEALKNIDLCFMGTIDAFCNMVLSEHPMKAHIPSDAAVISKEEIEALYRREYSKILSGVLGDSLLYEKAKRFNGCFYNAVDIFLTGMKVLCDSKNAHYNHNAIAEGSIDEIYKDDKEKILNILGYLMSHPEAVATDKPAAAKKSWDALLDGYDTLCEPWNDNLSNVQKVLKNIGGLRIIPEYEPKMDELGPGWEHFFAEHYTKGKLAWYEVNAEEDPFIAEKLMNHQFNIASDFLADCVGIISDDLRAEGNLTFFDYLLYLRDLLKEDASRGGELIKHIYNRHSYFLIDEFQDTNPLQAEIFFYLTAENPKEDWRECIPKKGSLFIVGDPKQSIYRFRNADVAAFLRVKKLFEDPKIGEVLYLRRNFRSSDDMCRWFNDVFTDLLPHDSDSQSQFNAIPTGEKKPYTATLGGAYTYEFRNTIALDDYRDPWIVASIIKGIVGNPDITIQDRDQDGFAQEPRNAEYKDFMLITPEKTHLSLYMNALFAYGIPFRVEGKVLFNECEPLICLSRIMSAVADPYDRKAVFAATKLSGCRISEDKIRDYSLRVRGMTPASVFNMLLDEERIFAKAGVHNAEYVYFALELLRSAEVDGTVSSIKQGAAYIESLVNGDCSEERCIQLQRDANRVHIANLHKVKGLEAPIVILADPKSKNHETYSRVDYLKDTPQSFIFALGDGLKTNAYADEQAIEDRIKDEEKLRLLYVAATRAADAIIIADIYGSKGEQLESNPWIALTGYAKKKISDVVDINKVYEPEKKNKADAEKLYDDAEKTCALADKTSLDKSYEIKRPSTITLKGITSSEDDYEDKAADEIKQLKSKKNPTLVGTLVHKVMEVLVSSGNSVDGDKLVKETVLEFGADDKYYADLLTNVVKAIRNGGYEQANNVPKDILNELLSAQEVFCELPFCYKEDESKIWHGVMDAVYKKDGKWHIIDYKTNADPTDLDTHYQEQLTAYIKAFKEMTGAEADALIYHIEV